MPMTSEIKDYIFVISDDLAVYEPEKGLKMRKLLCSRSVELLARYLHNIMLITRYDHELIYTHNINHTFAGAQSGNGLCFMLFWQVL